MFEICLNKYAESFSYQNQFLSKFTPAHMKMLLIFFYLLFVWTNLGQLLLLICNKYLQGVFHSTTLFPWFYLINISVLYWKLIKYHVSENSKQSVKYSDSTYPDSTTLKFRNRQARGEKYILSIKAMKRYSVIPKYIFIPLNLLGALILLGLQIF